MGNVKVDYDFQLEKTKKEMTYNGSSHTRTNFTSLVCLFVIIFFVRINLNIRENAGFGIGCMIQPVVRKIQKQIDLSSYLIFQKNQTKTQNVAKTRPLSLVFYEDK